jgi:hypothetical protein
MKIALAAFVAILLTGCSDNPPPVTKQPEAPPAPITGRQAFQYMYGSARIWSSDSEPLTIRSLNVPGVAAEPGKAGAWEVVFVSPSMARARFYTWSAVETEGVHKGVFAGQQEAWNPSGPNRPFSAAQIRVDTPEALKAATTRAEDYLKKPGKKPAVNFLLQQESATRFPDPVWRVMWGNSVSSAEYTVTVDATTGKVLAHD